MTLTAIAFGIRIYTTSDTDVKDQLNKYAFHFNSENDIRSTLGTCQLIYPAYIHLLLNIFPLYILCVCLCTGHSMKNIEKSINDSIKNKLENKSHFNQENIIEDAIENFNEVAKIRSEFDSIFTFDIAWYILMCLNDFTHSS